MISPNFLNCSLDCCQACMESVSDAGKSNRKMVQARLKLQIHCNMQDKHVSVQRKAVVHKRTRALRSVQ